MYEDEKFWTIFPVRTGIAQGKAKERLMLDAVGGADNFRTRVLDNHDGSTTLLRTKNGMPQFSTEKRAMLAGYLRGYVADIKSELLTMRGKAASFFINRSSGAWEKAGNAVVFGKYTVSPVASVTPDLWVLYGEKLRIFTNKAMLSRANVSVSGVPLIIQYSDTVPYSTGSDVFILNSSGIYHTTITGTSAPSEIYSAAELDANTEGYIGGGDTAGVAYSHSPCVVGFNKLHISAVGGMLQRSRTVALHGAIAPYATVGDYTSVLIPGFVYVAPEGAVTTRIDNGVWENPIPDGDLAMFELYARVGTPPMGVYSFVGYLRGDIVDDPSSATQTETWIGDGGHSGGGFIGWFGTPVTLSYSVTVHAEHTRKSSNGNRWNKVLEPIAAANAGSVSDPPWYKYRGRSFIEAPHTIEAGTLLARTCTGSSLRNDWSSQSEAVGKLNDVEVCRIVYESSGYNLTRFGSQFYNHGSTALDGLPAGLVAPKDNPYADEYNAVLTCSKLMPTGVTTSAREVSFNQYESQSDWSLSCKTRDYILFDAHAGAAVYLEGEFVGGKSSAEVVLSIVVCFKDVTKKKELRRYATTSSGFLAYVENVYEHEVCTFHPPPIPFAGFAPPFCCQGDFRFGAYSEPSDTGDPVFLMSIPLAIKMRDDWPDPPPWAYGFDPRMFKGVFGNYGGIGISIGFWTDFSAKVNIINFVDGDFVDWIDGVCPPEALNDTTFSEVYRT